MIDQALLRSRAFGSPFSDLEGFDLLSDLALDMRWSGDPMADAIWRELDPHLWGITHNPWMILQTASAERLRQVLNDRTLRKKIDWLVQAKRQASNTATWFHRSHPCAALTAAAYFSMEFMLGEALPIYSGGLGNVAGDQLKAAGDLGVPVVGVGLLYQRGYFRQVIDKDGSQQAIYPYNDPGQLPITPLRHPNGEWLRIEIKLPAYSVWLRAWQVQVGRVMLCLLDSNDAANYPEHRGITSALYAGGSDVRIQQELMLGLGGWRLLEALGIKPQICHFNEGHSAFTILDRARGFMEETHEPFEVALTATRAGNVFTTHTAVPAGFDRFPADLVVRYLGKYAEEKLGIGAHELLALGRQSPYNSSEDFNMAYLAVRGCGAVNGVSRLHGKVSRRIFEPLFPGWPEHEVPVGHVTNGIHVPTWISEPAQELWTETVGKECWLGESDAAMEGIRNVSDEKLWEHRNAARRVLVEYSRERLTRTLTASGVPAHAVERVRSLIEPDVLTLCFARRFATYKRPNLLLRDPERLYRLLTNPERPVQLFIAGKAHPDDLPAQQIIQEWITFIRKKGERPHAVFLSDYDVPQAELLVQGVDVWINTPRRPWEASGTSGMKVLANGGLNLSELDGWWAEAYEPDIGWSIGDGKEHGDDPAWDNAEAIALYDTLEHKVVPEFYDRDERGIPVAWLNRIRESMARLTPVYSADRTVREYTEKYYLPAAEAYVERSADNGAAARKIVEWRKGLERAWPGIKFGRVNVKTEKDQHSFEVEVRLGEADPESVRVELYAEGTKCVEMARSKPAPGTAFNLYSASVSASRPAKDYTPRIVPRHLGVAVPIESSLILWQR